ncbi:phosphatase PAP2 family protein [Calditerrivibrio sp.]|uniref:phosphatase PAP2 family protein n=1 Tax=Calditerrivibrio sp. TaxID=2792612 RepID=UPI003C9E7BDF
MYTILIISFYHFWDIPIITFFYQLKGTTIYNFAKNITDFAKAEYQLVPSLIFYIYFRNKNRYYANIALLVFVSVALSGLITDIIKFILGRYRPIEYFEHHLYGFKFLQTKYKYTSIPSGHSTTIFSAMYVLAIFLKKYRFPLIIIGLLMAFTRVISLNHYPSDVLAGILVAITISSILYNGFKKRGMLTIDGKSIQT